MDISFLSGVVRFRLSAATIAVLFLAYGCGILWQNFFERGEMYDLVQTLVGFRRLCPPVVAAPEGKWFSFW